MTGRDACLPQPEGSSAAGAVVRGAIATVIVGALGALGACAPLQQQADTLQALDDRVAGLTARVGDLSTQFDTALAGTADARQFRVTLHTELQALSKEVDRLPGAVATRCRIPAAVNACETAEAAPAVVNPEGKMLVGELEHVWLDPPGIGAIARVDTGAQSSSLHAANLVAFERDGDDWVRFNLEGDEQAVMIERRVQRHVKVYQQADRIGSRRPVIRMRVSLGDVQDTFEFTLADRSHLEYQILLGRNFLTDIALVDVAQQFVQPSRAPEPAPDAAQ